MKKIDLKSILANLYKASAIQAAIVEVPEFNFLMCDGHGDPNNSKLFQDSVEALFSLSYTIKFMVKKGEQQIDYGVLPLEGLWWAEDMSSFNMEDRSNWKWTLMIRQPEFVTNEILAKGKEQLIKKKDLVALQNVRFEPYKDGLSAQILHIGPYSEEPPTIIKLHEFIKENGFQLTGKHREIYLSDMRRTAPEKLKTIIRQPIKK